MLTHDDILAALQGEFPSGSLGAPPDGVLLVARLREPGLGMSDPTPYVFIPDIHLAPGADSRRFPWVTARDSQVELLTRLAELLGRLRGRDPNLMVWQLGDCFDLWRTDGVGGDPEADVAATQAAHGPLFSALFDHAGARLLAGNHDQELVDFPLPGGPQAMNTIFLDRPGGTADTLLAHGHQFDPLEALPRKFKEFFARGATELVPPTARSMLEAANPHWKPEPVTTPPPHRPSDANQFLHFGLRRDNSVPLLADAVNVVPYVPVRDPAKAFIDSFGGGGRKPTVDGPRQTFFTDIAWYAQQMSSPGGKDVRLVAIGHTHRARIVRGKRPDGTLFVLMDCGAWVGTSFLSDELDAPMANGQIGVKVGDEIRIYQLGYTERKAETETFDT
jgi:UDP-2,3-diacylglucosamine pyrophosphatase LpxH